MRDLIFPFATDALLICHLGDYIDFNFKRGNHLCVPFSCLILIVLFLFSLLFCFILCCLLLLDFCCSCLFWFFLDQVRFFRLRTVLFWIVFLFKITLLCTFHLSETSAWTVIPNEATSHLEGLTTLSTCNCNSKDLNIKELPLFYERMLQYWFEFKDLQSNKTSYTTIWNNQDIKIDSKTIFSVLGLIKAFTP